MEEHQWSETPQDIVVRNFNLPTNNSEEWDNIRQLLCNEIQHLLHHNFERLMHILYRIDVNENLVQQVIHNKNAASLLADLIIERQIQKVESRRKNS